MAAMKKTLRFVVAVLCLLTVLPLGAADFSFVPVLAISVFRIGGHSHTCRSADAEQSVVETKLAEWAKRNRVDAMGLGSPWTAENAKTAAYIEKEWRDNYYAGVMEGAKRKFDMAEVESKLAKINSAPGNATLFYLDNETPKQRYGHLWHVGFKATGPSWHDYDQGLRAWYSSYDDGDAAINPVNGKPQRRRTYREIVNEQRAAGAICIWAHPTSWWTTDGDPNGPFTTNIAAEMLPELMEDGYLDGMTVVGYDAFHRDYQALWFALLDRGYRVPAFAELDISFVHNTTSWDTSFFNLLPNDGKTKLTEEWIVKEFKAAHHTASSGPVVFLTVDDVQQGGEVASGEGKMHLASVVLEPAPGEKKLSKVELIGRGGEVLQTARDVEAERLVFTVRGTDAGGYLVVRVFGENDGDYAYKPQQHVRHCAVTNPVWLRTPAFQPPAPIRTKVDHMANPKVRELMDYLAKGLFRKDYNKGCTPGIVPVSAWRMDEMAAALRWDPTK